MKFFPKGEALSFEEQVEITELLFPWIKNDEEGIANKKKEELMSIQDFRVIFFDICERFVRVRLVK